MCQTRRQKARFWRKKMYYTPKLVHIFWGIFTAQLTAQLTAQPKFSHFRRVGSGIKKTAFLGWFFIIFVRLENGVFRLFYAVFSIT
jgi:hypothetical protein